MMKKNLFWSMFVVCFAVLIGYWLVDSSNVSIIIDGQPIDGIHKAGFAAAGLVMAGAILIAVMTIGACILLGSSAFIIGVLFVIAFVLVAALTPALLPIFLLATTASLLIRKFRLLKKTRSNVQAI